VEGRGHACQGRATMPAGAPPRWCRPAACERSPAAQTRWPVCQRSLPGAARVGWSDASGPRHALQSRRCEAGQLGGPRAATPAEGGRACGAGDGEQGKGRK
jgi:hypothetical protein